MQPPSPPHLTPPPPPPPQGRPPSERTLAGRLVAVGAVLAVLSVVALAAGGAALYLIFAVDEPTAPAPVVREVAPVAAEDTGPADEDGAAAAAEAPGAADEASAPEAGDPEVGDPEAGDPEDGGSRDDGADGPGSGSAAAPAADDPAAAAVPAPPPPPPTPKDCSVKKVKRRDNGTYVIAKSTLETYVRSPDKIDRLGSFGWARKKDGSVRGVRMRRMPCPGLMRAAGMRNGDIVLSVNGTPATSVARGLAIWAEVKRSGSARVVVAHKGEGKRTLRYILTD